MQVLRIIGAAALAMGLVSASQPLEARRLATCSAPRVRKPWDSLSGQEKSLYIEALELAIESGVIKDLAAMHLESMGETQAHHSCAFFAWHRRMLLALESYMRDLDPKFACLTIPYYDVHSAYANAANKKCKNMFDCSPIFQALGGAVEAYGQTQLVFNGEQTGGFPVKGAPFTKDCDDDKKVCGTMLRNNLEKKSVPSGAGFGSFLATVTRSKDYATFLEGIQFGLHNEVHNAVGGPMSTFASPRDVFFYSWHGAIDMYLATYHQCHLGVGNADPSSREAFTTVDQTCGGISGVGADSKVVMRVNVDGKLVDASQHPKLGKYFAALGDTMGRFGDTTTLGDFSYSYEFPSIIKTQILSNKDVCKGATGGATPAPSTPKPTTAPPKVSDGSLAGLNATVTFPGKQSASSGSGSHDVGNNTVTLPSPAPIAGAHTGIVVVKDTPAPSASVTSKPPSYGYGFDDTDDSSDDESSRNGTSNGAYGSGAQKPTEATSGSYWEWVAKTYEGLVKRFDGDMVVVAEQMRVIECMAFDKVFGVVTFSDDFVKNFHLASSKPVCGKKIEAVASGAVTVAVASPAAEFKPEQVTFAAPAVIEVVKKEAAAAAAAPVVEAPQINPAFIKTAEKTLQDAAVVANSNNNKAPTDVRSANGPVVVAVPVAADAGKKTKKNKHRQCAN